LTVSIAVPVDRRPAVNQSSDKRSPKKITNLPPPCAASNSSLPSPRERLRSTRSLERTRAASVNNADALGRPRRSVLAFDEMTNSKPKKFIITGLFLLGALEIFYGILWGRLRIYSHEASFAGALRLGELGPDQNRAFQHYIDLFQDQWHVVTLFGVLTIAFAIISAFLWGADKGEP
jgi:hypothetical protein